MKALPLNWMYSKIGDVAATIQYGYTASSTQSGDIRLLRITDIQNDKVLWENVPYCEISEKDYEKYALKKNDIVFVRTGATVGKSFLIEDVKYKSVFASYLIRFTLKEGILPRYIKYFFNSPIYWSQIFENAAGIGQPNFNSTKLSEIVFPLPPLPKQKRIVAKLDTLFAHLDQLRARLDKIPILLKQFRQAVLTQGVTGRLTEEWRKKNPGFSSKWLIEKIDLLKDGALRKDKRWRHSKPTELDLFSILPDQIPDSWSIVSWKNVGLSQNGKSFPSKDYQDKGVKLLRPGNLHVSGAVVWNEDNTKYLPAVYAEDSLEYLIGENEIVMNLTAQSLKDEFLGRVCLTQEDERCLLNQRQARIFPIGFDTKFCFWLLKSTLFRQFVDQLNTGTLIQHMYTWQLDQFEFALPPLEEQNEIVRIVESFFALADRIEATYQSLEEKIDRLPQAMLSKAFKGELAKNQAERRLEDYVQEADELLLAAEPKFKD